MAYIKVLTDDLARIVIWVGVNPIVPSGQIQKTIHRPKNVSIARWRKSYYKTLANKVEDEIKANPTAQRDVKLFDFVEIWKKEYGQTKLQEETYISYVDQLERIVLPELGHLYLDKITPLAIQKMINELSKKTYKGKPLSKRTVKYPLQVLSSVLGRGVKWEYLKENPCSKVELPHIEEEKKKKHYELDEISKLAKLIKKEDLKYQAIFYLGLSGGMRKSEILRLRIEDIDKNGVHIRKGKNEPSIRFVGLDKYTMRLLRLHATSQKVMGQRLGWEDTLLFTQIDGRQMHANTPTKKFKKICEKNNINWAKLHGLRHTMVSILISENVDLSTIASRAGHSRTSTTADIYSHMLKGKDEQAKEVIGSALEKARSKSG